MTQAMPPSFPSMPSTEELTPRLNAMLAESEPGAGPVEVMAREPHRLASFFPIEIVTCRMNDGTLRPVLLKYQSGRSHGAHGHRGGLAYEAEVYRRILAPRVGSGPKLYGTSTGENEGDTWLALEHLNPGTQVRGIKVRATQHAALVLASRWIARWHADHEAPAAAGSFGFLRRYDEHYYAGWVRRTLELTAGLHGSSPWLPRLCARAGDLLAPLWAESPTVIHGEFYTNNILLCEERIHAVDWEAAALGPGVIDLAALTEGTWPAEVVRTCEREYLAARWPGEQPPGFDEALAAARLYFHFRWLGDRADKTLSEKFSWRLEALRLVAARLESVEAGAPAITT